MGELGLTPGRPNNLQVVIPMSRPPMHSLTNTLTSARSKPMDIRQQVAKHVSSASRSRQETHRSESPAPWHRRSSTLTLPTMSDEDKVDQLNSATCPSPKRGRSLSFHSPLQSRQASPSPSALAPPRKKKKSFQASSTPPPTRRSSGLPLASAPLRKKKKKAFQTPEFKNGLQPDGDPKANDYCDTVKAVIIRACHDFEARIAAIDTTPDSVLQQCWALDAWHQSNKHYGNMYSLTPRIEKIVSTGCSCHAYIDSYLDIRSRISHERCLQRYCSAESKNALRFSGRD